MPNAKAAILHVGFPAKLYTMLPQKFLHRKFIIFIRAQSQLKYNRAIGAATLSAVKNARNPLNLVRLPHRQI